MEPHEYRSDDADSTDGWIAALIRSEVRKQAAFLATVTFVDGHNVEISRSSSEGTSDGQQYASCPGFLPSVGDMVVCQPVGGEPIIIGRVASGEPAGETIDVVSLDITGDVMIDGALIVDGGIDGADITVGPILPSVLGTGTPQLGMYLEGNGVWSYPTITDGAFVRPGIQLANTTTATSPTAGQCIGHYLGQSIKPVTQVTVRTFMQTAYVAGTGGTPWAEVGIATSSVPPTLASGIDLTMQGWVNVATTFNATGGQSATVSGLAIPAHSHVWVLWGSQGGTTGGVSYAPLGGLNDPTTTGLNQSRLSTRPSTMSGALTFTAFTGASNQAWWAAQFS